MNLKPVITEKAVMLIESNNILTFITEKKEEKPSIKKYFEELFDVKVDRIRTLIRNNKKYVYIKLNKENPAIDVATKLGIM